MPHCSPARSHPWCTIPKKGRRIKLARAGRTGRRIRSLRHARSATYSGLPCSKISYSGGSGPRSGRRWWMMPRRSSPPCRPVPQNSTWRHRCSRPAGALHFPRPLTAVPCPDSRSTKRNLRWTSRNLSCPRSASSWPTYRTFPTR